MRTILLLFVLLLTTLSHAQTLSAEVGGMTHYLAGDTGALITPDAIYYSSITYTGRDGYINIWHSWDAQGKPGYGNEQDYNIGKIFRFPKNYSLKVDLSYFDLDGPADLASLRVTGKKSYQKGDIYLVGQCLYPNDPQIIDGGVLYRVGANYTTRKWTGDVSVMGHDGILGKRPELFSSVRARLSKNIAKNISFTTTYQYGLGEAVTGLAPKHIWTVGFSLSH